jgi:hypothetical protein
LKDALPFIQHLDSLVSFLSLTYSLTWSSLRVRTVVNWLHLLSATLTPHLAGFGAVLMANTIWEN